MPEESEMRLAYDTSYSDLMEDEEHTKGGHSFDRNCTSNKSEREMEV